MIENIKNPEIWHRSTSPHCLNVNVSRFLIGSWFFDDFLDFGPTPHTPAILSALIQIPFKLHITSRI